MKPKRCEWKYGKQLLYTQVLKRKLGDPLKGAGRTAGAAAPVWGYIQKTPEPRPLPKAMQQERGAVLLDRRDR
jgi:hypothetical protein